jgi:N-acetylneuraminate synthase
MTWLSNLSARKEMITSKNTFIIAEAGVNHNGTIGLAKELIDVAVSAGADAVKFQTFRADKLLTSSAPKADYQIEATSSSESQYEMIKKLELSVKDHAMLIDYCLSKNIHFLSTPFDLDSVDLLSTFDIPLFKIPSGEITNGPLLLKISRTRKPIILSTGMSTLGEIELALGVISFGYINNENIKPSHDDFMDAYRSEMGRKALQQNVTLLHCITAYPAPLSEVNLKAMDTLRYAFDLPIGYSDHTNGIEIAIAAVARGATVIEKHFTLDRNLPGPDHKASLEPNELMAMVKAIRNVEQSLGQGHKIPGLVEFKNRKIARKSLVALCNIHRGEIFTESNLGIKRPGTGISGVYYWDWIDKISDRSYIQDELITSE